jgi:hypothetical protein
MREVTDTFGFAHFIVKFLTTYFASLIASSVIRSSNSKNEAVSRSVSVTAKFCSSSSARRLDPLNHSPFALRIPAW